MSTQQATPTTIDAGAALRELQEFQRKLTQGADYLGKLTEEDIAIATAPKEEVWREDMVTLYRYTPTVEKPLPVPVLIAYALVGRYQMIDLEAHRSFVRKLLAQGLDIYMVDWGHPKRAQRWLTIDDYVNDYLDSCVDVIRKRHGIDKINLLGICQGGVFSLCYAALHPEKLKTLVLTVTPVDFHADKNEPLLGAGYMNLWTRAVKPEDVDRTVEAMGSMPGYMVGFAFLMMNPVSNITKYTTELVEILDDKAKLLNFLKMERWIADRPGHPGEVLRQWLKDLYQDNKLVKNELVLGGKRVDLRNIDVPVLNVYATGDVIVPPCSTKNLHGKFGTTDYSEIPVPGGHIGTFVGAKAQNTLAPAIVDWLKKRN
jgi:polyhydroxyalkanoate synthase subunit PhaC